MQLEGAFVAPKLENRVKEGIVPTVMIGEGEMVWGCFSGLSLSTLVPVKGNVNSIAQRQNLDHCMFPTLWKQFGEGPY